MPSSTRLTTVLLATSALAAGATAAVFDLPVIIDQGYKLVELEAGTPGEKYRLLFDTGSASAWMIDEHCAEQCPHVDNWPGRSGYDISKSSTGRYTGQSASIEYLGGRVAGPSVAEVFRSGDSSWNATFIAANESNWSTLPAHGFLGLAFGSIADGGAVPIFEDMMANKIVDEPRFGIYYARSFDAGGSREDKYVDGEMSTISLISRGEYDVWRSVAFNLYSSRTACNGTKVEGKTDLGYSDVVFDTGASAILIPPSKLEEVYASIGMNWTAILKGDHIPLCSEFTNKWSVSFDVGFSGDSINMTLTGDQLALPGFAEREDACWPPFDDSGADGFTLIGTRLLRNFYTVWNYGDFPTENPYYTAKFSWGNLKEGF
ncbi:aspartic peptidase domain-containing protein [Stachybotrys elegans]|uniref:Aspartic peptidase domain-containing protein n=1 Tax=Stachybotrys elegans TaxID=80388 RepID=A0A8K0SIM8_9HYPO|nr:aspartic peptidase domain-containing protein [Stachybotrys elegans]